MDIFDSMLALFSGRVKRQGSSYVVEVPESEIEIGGVAGGEVYRIAVLPASEISATQNTSTPEKGRGQDSHESPVNEGEVLEVEIEDIGKQGDGIARVGPGYVIFVPNTEMGERVQIEITNVRKNMAFAEVIQQVG